MNDITLPFLKEIARNTRRTEAELCCIVKNTAASSGGGIGSATAANQATGNNSLASIDSKTPSLVGGAVPVVSSESAFGSNITSAGANSNITANFRSISIIKTNTTGTITITLSDGSTYPLSLQGEGISQSAVQGYKLPAYTIATADGATWKWIGVK